MVEYKCEPCNFFSKYKNDYTRHIKTKKHLIKCKDFGLENEILPKFTHKTTEFHTKTGDFTHKTTQFHTKTDTTDKKKFSCKFCDKKFTRKDAVKRHITKYCKKKNNNDPETLLLQLEEHKKEKEKLYDYIEKLIEKTGDTNINIENQTNTQNNQIILNNFGHEDISHISDKFMRNMLVIPYGSVQKLIEKVHFSNKKPENKNIALTNKKEKMIKIFKNNKWKYQNRDEILDELINTNYTRIDDFYSEKGKDKLKDTHNKIYENFQDKFENQDTDLHNKIKQDCEMLLLSDNL